MHWTVEIFLPGGAWFELARVESPQKLAAVLEFLCVTCGRLASQVKITGIDLPLEKPPEFWGYHE